jgi:TonB family protein
VIAVSCDSPDKEALKVMLDRAVAVSVVADDPGERDTLRQSARDFLYRKVCLVGHVARRGDGFTIPEFVPASASQIVSQEDGPPADWQFPGVQPPCDKSVVPPRVTRERRPRYTRDAMQANIQGLVWLQGVVTITGQPDKLRVVRSLDSAMGLDPAAMAAAKDWRFEPATKDGKPVPSVVIIEMKFWLK